MREDLEDVLELYAGMPPDGQRHWCERSLPSVEFESDGEREEFLTALHRLDKSSGEATAGPLDTGAETRGQPPRRPGLGAEETSGGAGEGGTVVAHSFSPGQRVRANLAGLRAGAVQLSQNVEAAYAMIDRQVSADPPVYRLKLLISYRGINELDVPAERIRPL
jgi:hypothetical protein